jgi:hypothetical protein
MSTAVRSQHVGLLAAVCSVVATTQTAVLTSAVVSKRPAGSKSAAAVLARFGTIEAIPNDPLDWDLPLRGAVRLAAVLRDHRQDAALYRTLATLRTDAAIDGELEDLEWRGVPRERFEAFCNELGFGRLRERPHRWQDAVIPG